ncbi:MAG: T9SS type A sorting domain-containing protein [Bacteroidales bacterium]
MRKIILSIIALCIFTATSGQPLSGAYSIPGTAPTGYPTIALAIADLNTFGVTGSGVTFNVDAGYTESITSPLLITATGTLATPIVFQKSGSGANPSVTRTDAGTLATTALGAQGDAVIIFQGSDFVTFDAIDVTANNEGIEYGYYLRKGSITNGCKNLTIKNATVTMNKGVSAYVVGIYSSNNDAASLVSSATGITITTTGGRNENVTLTGNTIQNTFAGIVLRGFNHTSSPYDLYDQNFVVGVSKEGNTIQNFAGNISATSYGIYLIYQNNAILSSNTINNSSSGGAPANAILYGIFNSVGNNSVFSAINNTISVTQGGSYALYGINSASTGMLSLDDNSITLNTTAPTTGIFGYIYNSAATNATSISVRNNTFNGSTIATSGATYLIYNNTNSPGVMTIENNKTAGSIVKTGASGHLYCYYNNGAPTGTENISENNFSNITVGGASYFYGIYSSSLTDNYTSNVFRNTISNINVNTGLLYSFSLGGSKTRSVYANTIHALQGGNLIYGILLNSGNPANLYRNELYDFTSSSVTLAFPTVHAIVLGIMVGNGTANVNLYNNFISDLKTPVSTEANSISAIHIEQGAASTNLVNVNICFNTIYLNATSSSTSTFGTSCIYKTATLMTGDFRNNILVNNSTPGPAGGATVVYRMDDSYNAAYYAGTSNNNDFYAGTPAVNRLLFYDGHTAGNQTLASYKSRVFPADDQSISVLPPFMQITSAPYDLTIDKNIPNALESGGKIVTSPISITTDFFNTSRYPDPAAPVNVSFNPKAPDIGAHEFGGVNIDIVPPQIIYTPLPNTSLTGSRTIIATITDVNSGVPTSGSGRPVLYWKTNAGNYSAAPAVSLGSDQFSFTFGGGALYDVVSYYIAAQDMAGTPNICSVPFSATAAYSSDPPAATPPPSNPYIYVIIEGLNGILTVGTPGGDFSNLTSSTGAFASINSKALTGNLTLRIISDLTEDGYAELNQWLEDGTGNYTLAIESDAAAERIISGSVANGGMIRLSGADRVTIDGRSGGSGRYLRFRNTNTAAPVLTFLNDATFNTVRNCFIEGSNTSVTGLISLGATNGTTGNDNITITQNIIRDRSDVLGVPAAMIYSLGQAGKTNSAITISNNEIYNFSSYGINVSTGNGDNWVITNNSFYNNLASPLTTAITSINFVPGGVSNSNLITGNFIGGQGPECSGNPWNNGYVGGALVNCGINVNAGNTISTSIQGNTIQNMLLSGTGNVIFRAIWGQSATDIGTITGNILGSLTVPGSITINGTQSCILIYIQSRANIANNILSNVTQTHATGVNSLYGMWLNGSPAVAYSNRIINIGPNSSAGNTTTNTPTIGINISTTPATVYNNVISLGNDGYTHNISMTGIRSNSGSGTHGIYFNSISIGGTMPAANSRACAAIQKDLGAAMIIKDNAVSVTVVDGAGGTALHKALNFVNNTNVTSDYNDLYTVNPNALAAWSTTTYNFANYKTASSLDANSLNEDPAFVSATDLHTSVPALNNGGITMAEVTNDFSGITRTNPPDIGAYEFTLPITSIHTLAATSIDQHTATLHGDINTRGEVVGLSFEYGTTISYGNTTAAVPATVRSLSDIPATAGLTGLVSNTLYHFRINGISTTSGETVHGADMTFTTLSSVPVITNLENITISSGQDTCFNASQTVIVAGNDNTFVVQTGGSATMIAGLNIIYLPGTTVEPGGYMHGYLTDNGTYCGAKAPALIAVKSGAVESTSITSNSLFRVYPNPTSGKFTLEVADETQLEKATIEIYGMNGIKVLSVNISAEQSHVFSIEQMQPGMYFIRMITGNSTETLKLIKQ